MLEKMNQSIIQEFGQDNCKFSSFFFEISQRFFQTISKRTYEIQLMAPKLPLLESNQCVKFIITITKKRRQSLFGFFGEWF